MEDRLFMAKAKEGIVHRPDGHYEMPLPFRDQHPKLPNNEKVAAHRLQQLTFRFSKDKKYKKDYTTFMSDMIKNNYAEKVPMEKECNDGQTWYIPHHGVYHPQNPDKICVVFDCSAQFQGESLNEHLLSGPDLTKKLIGVLTRFRQETVALMSDMEAMFYQVQVSEECRYFLRFLWWEDGDTSREPTRCRMRVHLFGATASPGCCNFALKRTADDHESEIGSDLANFLRQRFLRRWWPEVCGDRTRRCHLDPSNEGNVHPRGFQAPQVYQQQEGGYRVGPSRRFGQRNQGTESGWRPPANRKSLGCALVRRSRHFWVPHNTPGPAADQKKHPIDGHLDLRPNRLSGPFAASWEENSTGIMPRQRGMRRRNPWALESEMAEVGKRAATAGETLNTKVL